jgi:ribonuclease P protein component
MAKNNLQNRDISKIYKKSKPYYSEHLVLRFVQNSLSTSRFCFIVSNKIDKRATKRNALRRRLRAIMSASELQFGFNCDVIVQVKKNFDYPYSFSQISSETKDLLRKAGLVNDK